MAKISPDHNLGMKISEHGAGPFLSYGARMRDYVCIPEALMGDEELLVKLLQQGHAYVLSLPPK